MPKESYKKYNSKREIKPVSFLKKEHKEVLEYANGLDNFSQTVRELLKEKMENEKRNELQAR